jgi:cytochrome P450
VVTRYDDIRAVLLDNKTFVCGRDLDLAGSGTLVSGGVTIPTNPFRMGMMEMDGTEAQQYRRLVLPWLSARAVEEHRPRLVEIVTWLIDRVAPLGHMDVVSDLANPLPALVTLDILGLPLDRWEDYARILHGAVYRQRGSVRDLAGLMGDLKQTVQARRATVTEPQSAFDALLCGRVDGRSLTDDEVVEMVFMLLNGGVDTSTSVIAHLLLHLDTHPEQRHELAADPTLVSTFVDDLIRWVTPGTGVARTVVREVVVAGTTLHPGDRVLLGLGAGDNDPEVYADPDEVITGGRRPPHLAFGLGAHRCVGSFLAPAEIGVLAEEVIRRLPDYRVVHSGVVAYPSVPLVSGYLEMPATFTPAPVEGSIDPAGLPPRRDLAAAARLSPGTTAS